MAEHSPPINNGPQEQTPAPQDVDVILDVSELEVDRIKLTVTDLSAHVSVLAELASLLNLQVGVHARLEEVELEIEGVRAKVLLKVRLDDVRAIIKEALETVAEHPEILGSSPVPWTSSLRAGWRMPWAPSRMSLGAWRITVQ